MDVVGAVRVGGGEGKGRESEEEGEEDGSWEDHGGEKSSFG